MTKLRQRMIEDMQLRITPERLCQGEISPFQYGQFIEYLCALTPSMFSEQLFDGIRGAVDDLEELAPSPPEIAHAMAFAARTMLTAAFASTASSTSTPTPAASADSACCCCLAASASALA